MGRHEIKIGDRAIGPVHPPYIIAEVGIGHGGNLDIAKQGVRTAANLFADAVKFQHHIGPHEMHHAHPAYNTIGKLELSQAQLGELKDLAESRGLDFLCTPFSVRAAEELEELGVEAWKVGSGECNHLPLLKYIAATGKPAIVSTGMHTLEQMEMAYPMIDELCLLHCMSVYPTADQLATLEGFLAVREEFRGTPVGVSHHGSIWYPLACVAHGASVVEMHLQTYPGSRDRAVEVCEADFTQLVQGARAIRGYEAKLHMRHPLEAQTASWALHGLYATRPISRGEVLSEDNMRAMRPSNECMAADWDEVAGRETLREFKQGEPIRWNGLG